MIQIDIVSDTVCPWCFIGKRRLESALEQRVDGEPVSIAWRPYQLNPEMPPEGMDRAAYLESKFGGPERAHAAYERVRRVGSNVGIDFAFERMRKTPNTIASHRLVHWAAGQGRQNEMVETLFRAYFLEGRDIGAIETLAECAAIAGLPAQDAQAYLETAEDVELIRGLDARARGLGIDGVPCFIFNGQYAISGAQEPGVFLRVFEVLREGPPGDGAAENAFQETN